jgi:hypothetical protein
MSFLKRVYSDAPCDHNALEFVMNVVEYLFIDLQRLQKSLIRVLKT